MPLRVRRKLLEPVKRYEDQRELRPKFDAGDIAANDLRTSASCNQLLPQKREHLLGRVDAGEVDAVFGDRYGEPS